MSSAFCQCKNPPPPHYPLKGLLLQCYWSHSYVQSDVLSLSIFILRPQYFSSSKIAVFYWQCWLKNVLTNLTTLLAELVRSSNASFTLCKIGHIFTDDQWVTSMVFSAGKSQYLAQRQWVWAEYQVEDNCDPLFINVISASSKAGSSSSHSHD